LVVIAARHICLALLVILLGACSPGDTVQETDAAPEATSPAATPDTNPESWLKASCKSPARHIELIQRGYYPGRSPDVTMTPKEPHLFATETGTTHSGPWDYVQEIPMVLYGPGMIKKQGDIELDRETTTADVAPTVAELLDTPFPDDRAGSAITEALVPDRDKPKLVVVIVWDGGGWNVLNRWPDSWPFLASIMERGTNVTNAVVGSSPSVTPAVHANIGTGTFPDEHGLVDIWLRRGKYTQDSWENLAPRNLLVPTLADLYDQAMDNEPEIAMVAAEGWHLGMIGHGAALPGGDKDIAVLEDDGGGLTTNPRLYSLPSYLDDVPGVEDDISAVDAEDGALDGLWMGKAVLEAPEAQRRGPVRTLEQTRQIKALIEQEGFGADDVPDLLYTNYKQVDLVGHISNMNSEDVRSVIEWTDRTLEDLTGFLDDTVGKGEWAMVLTADHGQGPSPSSIGAYPIDVLDLKADIAAAMGQEEHELLQRWRPTGYWLEPADAANEANAEKISDFVAGYRVKDAARGDGIPEWFEGSPRDHLFESAFPMARVDDVLACARGEG
jgi:hypothetical protein